MAKGGHVWDTTRYGDTINERAVRILVECILVNYDVHGIFILEFINADHKDRLDRQSRLLGMLSTLCDFLCVRFSYCFNNDFGKYS